jgi:dTDP-4-amino-4,6-dideoxygalactose transaminase
VLTGLYAQRYRLDPADFPNSVIADRLSLALPLYPQMTDAEQDAVVAALHKAAVTVTV